MTMHPIHIRYEIRRRLERIRLNLVFRLPRWLVAWCMIRAISEATSGRWADEVVPDVRAMDVLDRWVKWNAERGEVMTTMKNWFDQFTADTGEKVEFICLGEVPTWWGEHEIARWNGYQPNVVLPFGGGEPWLDVDFDEGFGGNETPNFCAWSPNWVIFSDNYDGAEGIQYVPRNPTDHTPIRPGGG